MRRDVLGSLPMAGFAQTSVPSGDPRAGRRGNSSACRFGPAPAMQPGREVDKSQVLPLN